MNNKQDSRQTVHHSVLRRLSNLTDFNANGYNQLKELLLSMNFEFSQAFELYANSTPNLVLNVGTNIVTNTETGYRHSNPPINKQFPTLTSGTITLPAASGGTIIVSPTASVNPTLTITANAFIKALIECDSQGNLSVSLGNEGATEALATFPGVNPTAFQIGLLIIQTVAGVVQPVTSARVIQFQGGGGSGSGDGSGVLQPITGYKWLQFDEFDDTLISADSTITTTSYTNAAFDLSKSLFRMSCDKSRTVSTNAGTSLTINLAAGFTVAIGDIVYVTSGARSGQWRRISAVGSQTSFALDSAFTGGNASGGDTLMISQAVWTKDLVNFGSVSEKTRARDQYSGNLLTIAVDYFDSLIVSDDVPDYVDTARVVVSASNSGLVSDVGIPVSNLFSTPFVRQAYPAQINTYTLSTNTNQERLFLTFFPNPSNASVTTGSNLLRYESSFFVEDTVDNGGTLNSAYCYSDGSGTEINCLAPTVSGGLTQVETTWSFIPTVNPGTTRGQITVFVDGMEIPRFVSGSTADAYFTEVQNSSGIWNTVRFHTDLSALFPPVSIEIIKTEGIVDTNNQNTANIASLTARVVALENGPTIFRYASGSGTHNVTSGAKYIRVRMVGAGGGGSGSSSNAFDAGSGGNGTNTTFGSSLLTAGLGSGGIRPLAGGSTGGAGGSNTINSPAIAVIDAAGGTGTANLYRTGGNVNGAGGPGGNSYFGGGGGGQNSTGSAAKVNSGSGGGGGGQPGASGDFSPGAGGGAGGYIEAIISTLAGSYAYAVGTAGGGGGAGSAGAAGGAGGSGLIVVEEYF